MSHVGSIPVKDNILAAWDVIYTVQLTQEVPTQAVPSVNASTVKLCLRS